MCYKWHLDWIKFSLYTLIVSPLVNETGERYHGSWTLLVKCMDGDKAGSVAAARLCFYRCQTHLGFLGMRRQEFLSRSAGFPVWPRTSNNERNDCACLFLTCWIHDVQIQVTGKGKTPHRLCGNQNLLLRTIFLSTHWWHITIGMTGAWSVFSKSQDVLAHLPKQHTNEGQRHANKQTCRKAEALPRFISIRR